MLLIDRIWQAIGRRRSVSHAPIANRSPIVETMSLGKQLASSADFRFHMHEFLAFNYRTHGDTWLDQMISGIQDDAADLVLEEKEVVEQWLGQVREKAARGEWPTRE